MSRSGGGRGQCLLGAARGGKGFPCLDGTLTSRESVRTGRDPWGFGVSQGNMASISPTHLAPEKPTGVLGLVLHPPRHFPPTLAQGHERGLGRAEPGREGLSGAGGSGGVQLAFLPPSQTPVSLLGVLILCAPRQALWDPSRPG